MKIIDIALGSMTWEQYSQWKETQIVELESKIKDAKPYAQRLRWSDYDLYSQIKSKIDFWNKELFLIKTGKKIEYIVNRAIERRA